MHIRKVFSSLLMVLLFATTLAAEECETRNARDTSEMPKPTAPPTVSVADIRDGALVSIKDYPRVRDAAIGQDGNKLSLVIIVDYATVPSYAQQLGDNFVRLVKSLLRDGDVGKRIGTGEYDYLIGVYYPNEKQLAMGAKAKSADRISW